MLKRELDATIIVDLETGRPIEVLRGREGGPLAEWLSKHPEIEFVCRARARAYREATSVGAPQARRVADRWHLLHNSEPGHKISDRTSQRAELSGVGSAAVIGGLGSAW